MKTVKKLLIFSVILVLVSCSREQQAGNIPAPEDFFGFTIGTDKKLAHPEEIVNYFKELDSVSDRIFFEEVGRTTDDNPYVQAIISSPENIRNLEKYKEMNAKLADPRKTTDDEAQRIIQEGKTIVAINCSIHATEVSPAQMSVALAYYLVSDNSPYVKNILNNVILVLTPMHNPDGYKYVVDWWRKYVGTEYEGSSLPYLYQRYTGHDNNRDWYMFTQKESQLSVNKMHNVWHPQIVVDMHQMGSGCARLFVPPFTDPYEPNIDPIIIANVNMLGTYMLDKLTAKGLGGVESYSRYDGWTPARAYQHYHGGIRILTEAASVRIAAPIEISQEALRRSGALESSVFRPLPWQGGEWTLNDLVTYDFEACRAVLENAANLRETWLSNFYQIGKNAVADKTDPYAVIIPAQQDDKYTTKELLEALRTGAVEIHYADSPFTAGGREFAAGSAVIYMNQPYAGFAKTLLEKQVYPELRQYPGGPLKRPYDVVAHTLPLLMGVDVVWIDKKFEADTRLTAEVRVAEPDIAAGDAPNGFIISHKTNGMYVAVNRFLEKNIPVLWSNENFIDHGAEFPAGTVIIDDDGSNADFIRSTARELNIDVIKRESSGGLRGSQLAPVKLGLFQSWSGNMEEGWTRWVVEKYEIPYESMHNNDVKSGSLNNRFNVIMFAGYNENSIINGRRGNTPPEYTGGIGSEGVNNLKEFVRNGGTLITYGSSNAFAIKQFNLGISQVNLPRNRFNIPGSILRVSNNTNHPVAFGLPKDGNGFFRQGSAFDVAVGKVVARYANTDDMLLSGWAEGTELIKNKACVVEAPYGRGRVVLIGINPIYRAQSRETFKYVFNAMFYGAASASSQSGLINQDN